MNIIVIGGGAAGMMAALTAAEQGARVILLEKNEKLGKKIYITGKGRCNFTNACDFDTFIANVVTSPKFMYSSLRAFTPGDMISFLEESGCVTKVERGNRAFPASDHASDVTAALMRRMKDAGVRIELQTEVNGIRHGNAGAPFRFEVRAGAAGSGAGAGGKRARVFRADRVIVATGGLSYPATGSTGDGYRFASEFGLTVTETCPALVSLLTAEQDCRALQGVSLKNVSLTLLTKTKPAAASSVSPGKNPDLKQPAGSDGIDAAQKKPAPTVETHRQILFRSEPGELLFTHFGLSGPLVLTASSLAAKSIAASKGVSYFGQNGANGVNGAGANGAGHREHYRKSKRAVPDAGTPSNADSILLLSIDLKPALSEEQLDARILRDFETVRNQDLSNALGRLLISPLRTVIPARAGIPMDKKVRDITREERARLVHAIKHLEFTVTGTGGYSEAVITHGGVATAEIDPRTMESKKVPGLYFAGEVLDVDAFTGGFNLQIAWSTGRAAGRAAAAAW